MSSLATNTTALRTLTGGLPNAHQDTFPSILFLLLFGATCLLSLYRLAGRYRRPTRLLLAFLRIHVFEAVRVATFIVRLVGIANYRDASKGDGSFSTTLLIVEQVLLSVGYAMPASTLVQLAGFHAGRGQGGSRATHIFTLTMELTLMGAIVLGVIAGTKDDRGGRRAGRTGPGRALLRARIAYQGDAWRDIGVAGGDEHPADGGPDIPAGDDGGSARGLGLDRCEGSVLYIPG
ncbi:hypothetical protein EWM64_g9389 [Hericium alpestre]|uniref:Uncharacterized protein n=1 Tax=Hericium alpestre TaxID=135208 RepID=A0A4Y9ZJK0_9AGAM|nr:hypothetical protein EWM64_g9389 [Hericium alpestre]